MTRASRDGGIEAIPNDPDPIRGGKFIIQAKRYNHVVPISAIRELNGIMADEGAVKGKISPLPLPGNKESNVIQFESHCFLCSFDGWYFFVNTYLSL